MYCQIINNAVRQLIKRISVQNSDNTSAGYWMHEAGTRKMGTISFEAETALSADSDRLASR